jgi:hypothetical protein
MVNNKKKWIVMNPIWCRMKKRNPSSGQNNKLLHWWLLVHSDLFTLSLGAKVKQQPPMYQLVILSIGWVVFSHSASNGVHHSPFLFVTNHCTFFWGLFFVFFPWI